MTATASALLDSQTFYGVLAMLTAFRMFWLVFE